MADYAISNVPRRVVYAPSGVGPYAFTFEILNQTDIAVYKASTLLTLTTDYTVIINANGTGSVTLVATAGTSNITIVGAKNIQRTTDFTTGGDLFANTLNDELDNQTIFIQQVAETAERGLKAPVVDPTDINMTLPAKASRVGTVLAFNATTGNPEAGPSIGAVTTVAAQSANINTVATNIASVNTVAGNIANVNTVAGISSDVTMVATFQYNVNTVADDLNEPVSEINTVAVNIGNVNTVGTNISNVNTVGGNNANVTTVAGISGNVTTVAGVAAGVTTVAGISSNVTTVAGVAANVTTVAGISSNVTTVATNNANVTTVAGSIANVNNVGGNIANVNQVAADTAVINSASANAATATTKAAEALASANSASASAAAASAVALGNEPVRHSIRPSLLLDFANTKTLDPRITFTRASTGTFYDGKTVAKAEENLIKFSQGTGMAANWGADSGGSSARTDNYAVAPDGTTTAMRFVTTNANYPNMSQAPGGTFTGTYTLSFWASVPSGTLVIPSGSFPSPGTATTTWQRFTVTGTLSSATLIVLFNFGAGATLGLELLIWGVQLEQRGSVSAYTPTTTAPITNYIPALQTAASGVPRFEHDPVTGESLGLEIEEQRANLFLRSEEFDNATWVKDDGGTAVTVIANTIIAPNGTLTGDKLNEAGGVTQNHVIRQSATVANSTAYTFTFYAKAAERGFVYTQAQGGFGFNVVFNLTSGAVGVTSGTFTSATMTAVGNGWYRCAVTATSSGTTVNWYVEPQSTNAIGTHLGVANNGIYLWGAQLELGAFSTSYIKTEGSTVTRAPDSASMIGANFSSWYKADEGTVYVESPISSGGAFPYLFTIQAASDTTRIFIYKSSATATSSTAFQFEPSGGGLFTYGATSTKFTAAYKFGDYGGASNITAAANFTSGAVPIVDRLFIGCYPTGRQLNGTIKKFAYYPKRLQNSELVSLTTV